MTPEQWHGTIGGYTNHGCRCDECRTAFRLNMRRYRERRFPPGTPCATPGCHRRAARATGNGFCKPCSADLNET